MSTWTITEPDRLTLDGEVVQLKVNLIAGRLNVVGADGPARVEVSQVSGDQPITVSLGEDGTLTVAHPRIPRTNGLMWWLFGRKLRVDVSIAVPTGTRARLNVISGSIVASTLRAGALLDVTSGRITLLGLDGDVTAKVASGTIDALSVGGRLALETVSGEITVADSTAGRVHARSISGAVTCDLDNPPSDSQIHLETTSGEITARVREDSDLKVDLHATSGRVTCAFSELQRHGKASVSGQLGAGAGRGHLHVNATSGNISLLRRPVDYDENV